jgi:hypothetical protein
MRQSGGTPPPAIAVGAGGSQTHLELTAASLPNRQSLGNGPLFFSAWLHYTPASITNNIKLGRYWALEAFNAPGFFWFASGNNPAGDHGPTMGALNDGNWHQMKHLFQWNTQTYVRFYFDNVLRVDTNPPGFYNATEAGFTEGEWENLAAGDQIDSYAWESQGNADGGGSNESYYLSDLFVDLGYNRVELCNAATYVVSNHCEMQPYTAWPANNGSLTITLNRGTFGAGASAFLYLCNASDVCSLGYAVTLGGTGTPAKPTNLHVVPGDVAGLLLAGFVSIATLSRRKA